MDSQTQYVHAAVMQSADHDILHSSLTDTVYHEFSKELLNVFYFTTILGMETISTNIICMYSIQKEI